MKNKSIIASSVSTIALSLLTIANVGATTPTATSFNGVPQVGALFSSGYQNTHGCTATVLESGSHDEIITAAHCVRGSGSGMTFAPGYNGGTRPYGTWTITKAFVPSQWVSSQSPLYDYAVLTVSKNSSGKNIQDVTGGFSVTSTAQAGSILNIPAYNYGSNDRPIQCNAPAYRTGVYSSFDCNNYNNGVSGSPFLVTASSNNKQYISGVIGGLYQGGCTPSTSYSSPFNYSEVKALMVKADSGVLSMNVPTARAPQC